MAQSRARNDASNRAEFLHSIAEKRRRLSNASESPWADDVSTCARTDAKTLDRDVQMKYDIAKNEDGPLRRTMKIQRESGTIGNDASSSSIKGKQKAQTAKTEPDVKAERPEYEADLTSDRHSGLDERLVNVETHLAVRYGKSIAHVESECSYLHFSKYHRLLEVYLSDSNCWKTISYVLKRITLHGLRCTSTSQTEA